MTQELERMAVDPLLASLIIDGDVVDPLLVVLTEYEKNPPTDPGGGAPAGVYEVWARELDAWDQRRRALRLIVGHALVEKALAQAGVSDGR